MGATSPAALSVYVHIPFCSRRCDYCDFATWTDRQENVTEYIDSAIRQWEYSYEQYGEPNPTLTSIFFGGGTPNFIDADHIVRIIEAIDDKVPINGSTEITVESNPDHVSMEKMRAYSHAGVNRISLGIQSTQDHVLQFLGREHSKDHVMGSREIIADADIENVSGDFIYGSANETLNDWQATLEDAFNLGLSHISAYALGIESGTPLGRAVADREKQATDDDDLADKYEIADSLLTSQGYEWYEISNWSQPGRESQHNLSYWRGSDVIAVGCAAHGYTKNTRWSTPHHIDTYLDRFSPARNSDDLTDGLFLSQDGSTTIDRAEELFSLQLRTREGVTWPQSSSPRLNQFIDGEFIRFNPQDRRISLTLTGRLMAHRLMVDLYEEYAQISSVVE